LKKDDTEEAQYLPLLLNEIDKLQGELGNITANSGIVLCKNFGS